MFIFRVYVSLFVPSSVSQAEVRAWAWARGLWVEREFCGIVS